MTHVRLMVWLTFALSLFRHCNQDKSAGKKEALDTDKKLAELKRMAELDQEDIDASIRRLRGQEIAYGAVVSCLGAEKKNERTTHSKFLPRLKFSRVSLFSRSSFITP